MASTGETYPDITLLQPLAFQFGVSVDVLLGYDEEKIKMQIDEKMEEYYRLYHRRDMAAFPLIKELYREYPHEDRVMNAYMWSIVGDMADNEPAAILENEEELTKICDRLLEKCSDENLRHQAWNMRAKILHAKGKTEEALAVYREHMCNWYQTVGQKSEQLFAKDTPEFLTWVKRNAYELAAFAADKFHKSIFFDHSIPYQTRIGRIEAFGDAVAALRKETEEFFWAAMEKGVIGRLFNDLVHREGEITDILRVGEKLFSSGDAWKALAVREGLCDAEKIARTYGSKFYAAYILESNHPHYIALRENPEFMQMLIRYGR